ncbi:MAG: malto-oligosyltrehalose synthase [Dehalococcoidia bacterium]
MGPPLATYRLQFNKDFGFDAAVAIVPYLRRLGITHLYASPVFASRSGSPHGYDVIDPNQLDPELGGETGFRSLAQKAYSEGLGLILDIVPNHMAADFSNPWWRDVLGNGRASAYASYFDIDWDGGQGKLILPVLGKPLPEALASGEVGVEADGDTHVVTYFDKRWPLSAASERLAAQIIDGGGHLEELLHQQAYRLAYWRDEPPNYRRFFDINDLVSLRVEDAAVFDAAHALALRLVREGSVAGLRVDHVDGLHDPAAYLRRLREAVGPNTYLVVEKILGAMERLPADWPVQGTTGYDFLAVVNGLAASERGVEDLGRAYARSTGTRHSFLGEVRVQKRRMLEMLFANETAALAGMLREIAERDLAVRNVPVEALENALMDVTARMPVYRTYADPSGLSEEDRRLLGKVFSELPRGRDGGQRPVVDVLRRILTLDFPAALPRERRDAWIAVVMRWQQLSGPATAKGLEDTAFYRYHRLVSLNEVGAEARAEPPERVHRFLRHRAREWPQSMNATSTHDTKRSEDVRARLHALSWMADEWAATVSRWQRWNARWKQDVDGSPAPDANMEWLVYQTLVGMWPLQADEEETLPSRLKGFLTKAAREAKEHTSWREVNGPYEHALLAFADALLDVQRSERFLRDVRRVVDRVAPLGVVVSLAQLTIKATAPGVPDFYQGQELWEFSLTDPDNRRPVDYGLRERLLGQLAAEGAPGLAALIEDQRNGESQLGGERQRDGEGWRDGRIKLYVTSKLLELRRAKAALFASGTYLPIEARPKDDIFSFARRQGDDWVITVVPRALPARPVSGRLPLGRRLGGRGSVVLPSGAPVRWLNVLTGAELTANGGLMSVPGLLASLPVAVLVPA